MLLLALGSLVAFAPSASAGHAGPDHWDHDGLLRSQIYFVDHTGPFWPVATVTYKWNEASGVDSYYETSCPNSNLNCVHVRGWGELDPVPAACVGAFGCTISQVRDNEPNHYKWARVYLNHNTVDTDAQARKTTCHELGHVLGLAHRSTNDSCMRSGASPPIDKTPDDHDFNALENLYDHTN